MKSILVTGASKGIGAATVQRLARAGWRVYAGVRRDEDGERLRADRAGEIVPLRIDVTDAAQIAAAAARIEHECPDGLDGLVNNAGIAVAGPLEYLPVSALREQLEINVIGQIAVTQAALPALRRARGRIVFVSSISGLSSLPFVGAYGASKHALEALADALRLELQPAGIPVTLIEPGMIATPIWETATSYADSVLADAGAGLLERYGKAMETMRRVARKGTEHGLAPDVVARVIEEALTAEKPRIRYLIGRDARLRLLLERMLPDWLRDRAITKALERM